MEERIKEELIREIEAYRRGTKFDYSTFGRAQKSGFDMAIDGVEEIIRGFGEEANDGTE